MTITWTFVTSGNASIFSFVSVWTAKMANAVTPTVVLHLFMVVASGTWNNIRSMITGRYAIVPDKTGDHA